jgi:predicted GIY-YIG superfamily endonuclease
LWEKEQLLVLISRVRQLSNLIFIGDQTNILTTVMAVMSIQNPWKDHIDALVDGLQPTTYQSQIQTQIQDLIKLQKGPAYLQQLPSSNTGNVYLLLSSNGFETYVGETNNLRRRLTEHNSGHGARATEHTQWGLFAYVSGFQSYQGRLSYERKQIEGAIHRELGRQISQQGRVNAMQSLNIFRQVVGRMNQTEQYNGRLKVSVLVEVADIHE